MAGVITTGNISRLLQEGVKNVFGQAYNDHPQQWDMLFTTENSKKAFELDQQFNDGESVNAKSLLKIGLIDNQNLPIKILGKGGLSKKLIIENLKVSKTAHTAIEKAGGKVQNA